MNRILIFGLSILITACSERATFSKIELGQQFLIPANENITDAEKVTLNKICSAFNAKKNMYSNSMKIFEFDVNRVYCEQNPVIGKANLQLNRINNVLKFTAHLTNSSQYYFESFETDTNGLLSSFCSQKDNDTIPAVTHLSPIMKEYVHFRKEGCSLQDNNHDCFERITLLKKDSKSEFYFIIKNEELLVDVNPTSLHYGIVKHRFYAEECTDDTKSILMDSTFIKN